MRVENDLVMYPVGNSKERELAASTSEAEQLVSLVVGTIVGRLILVGVGFLFTSSTALRSTLGLEAHPKSLDKSPSDDTLGIG